MLLQFQKKRSLNSCVFKAFSIHLYLLTSTIYLLFCFSAQAAEVQKSIKSAEIKQDSSVSDQAEKPIETKQNKPKKETSVVVSATRYATNIDTAGGSHIQVITKKDIKNLGAKNVIDVLKTVPGINVATTGSLSSVRIGGFGGSNTLVLLDGIMYNDSMTHSTDFNEVLADSIERIEIVRGSQSVLYGSNAVAGVINIITNQFSKKPYEVHVGLEGGSYRTWKTYTSIAGTIKDLQYILSTNLASSKGYSIANAWNKHIPHNGNTSENDGWNKVNAHLKLKYNVTKNLSVFFTSYILRSSSDYDDNTGSYAADRILTDPMTYASTPEPHGKKEQRTEVKRKLFSAGTDISMLDKALRLHIAYQHADSENDDYDNDNKKSGSNTSANSNILLQSNVYVADQILTVGASRLRENFKAKPTAAMITKKVTSHSQSVKALWLQDQWITLDDDMVILAGLRYDKHSSFGSAKTYRIAPSYRIHQIGTTLKTAYGTGFKAPSLYQLYTSKYGNDKLNPEKSKTLDIGVEQVLFSPYFKLGVNYFKYQIKDLIGYDPKTYVNIQTDGKTTSEGSISTIGYAVPLTAGINLNYTYTHTRDAEGRPAARMSKKKIMSQAFVYITPKIQTHTSIIYEGKRPAVYAADKDGHIVNNLDSYVLVNANIQYAVNKNWDIYGQIDNLTDTVYEEAWSYARPRRSFYVGTHFSF